MPSISAPAPFAAWYVFCLGVALGMTVLAMSAYLSVSPRWLRWCLLASGGFAASRYVTMALFASGAAPQVLSRLTPCWFGTSIGLTFPGVVAMDQLVRHPAMSPKKLVTWYAPFLLTYLVILAFGRYELVADPLVGVSPRLVGTWIWVLAGVQGVFVLGMWWIGALLIRKIPSARIRIALGVLMAAYAYLGLDGALLALGHWYVRPFLFSELLAFLAIWFAFETARNLAAS